MITFALDFFLIDTMRLVPAGKPFSIKPRGPWKTMSFDFFIIGSQLLIVFGPTSSARPFFMTKSSGKIIFFDFRGGFFRKTFAMMPPRRTLSALGRRFFKMGSFVSTLPPAKISVKGLGG